MLASARSAHSPGDDAERRGRATRAAGDPAVRAALDRGRRAHARAPRPRRGAAEAGARDPARRARPSRADRPPRRARSGATTPPQNVAGSLQTFVSMLRRHLDSGPGARAGSSSSPSPRRTASRPSSSRSISTASTSCSSARRASRRGAPARSLEQALALVRGEVLEDEPYATWAQDLRGSYQGRVLGAHLEAADAALAELDFAAALAHSGGGVRARPLQRARAPHRDARSVRARPSARGACAVSRVSRIARRGARSRADGRDARSRVGDPAPGGRPRTLLPRPIAQPDADVARARPSACSAGSASSRRSRRRRGERSTGSFALLQIEGDAGLGKTTTARRDRARSSPARSVGRAQLLLLEQHLPVRAARRARSATPASSSTASGCRRSGRSCRSSPLDRPAREFADIEALEALVQVISENAPVVLMLDDLHSADPATIAALDYLPDPVRRSPRRARYRPSGPCARPGDHPIRRLQPDADRASRVRSPPTSSPHWGFRVFTRRRAAIHASSRTHWHRTASALELSSSLAETLLAQVRAEGDDVYRTLENGLAPRATVRA